jgi:hypothetical protein
MVRYSAEDMADIALDNPPAAPRKPLPTAAVLLPPLLFLAAMMMAADFTAIAMRPLHVLHVPYVHAMDYAHFIIPGACALAWLATFWKWPKASSIICVLLCFVLIGQIPAYAERRVARLPVTRWLETDEAKSFESRNGFPIYQVGSKEGEFVLVAPENAARARDELSKLGVVR